jgi:hypothetical protein
MKLPIIFEAQPQMRHIRKTHMKIWTRAGSRMQRGTLTWKCMTTAIKFDLKGEFLSSFSGTKFTAEVWLTSDTVAPFQRGDSWDIKNIRLPTAIP